MSPLERSQWTQIMKLRAPQSALAIKLRELDEELVLVLEAKLELAIDLSTEDIRIVSLGF